jgi:hypothetical protein
MEVEVSRHQKLEVEVSRHREREEVARDEADSSYNQSFSMVTLG